jgi:serine/threonine protein kinase
MQLCHKQLNEDQIAAICAHMIKGLIYLHSHHIVHRDLKAGNVLLTKDGKAKLADFGVSAKLTKTLEKKKTIVGSPYWMAPEVITVTKDNQEGYDMKADIWSLGITAIEMAEQKPPLFEIASLRVIFLIPVREPPTLKDQAKWSDQFNDFISICLQKDARKRPSSIELLQHPFIQKGLQKDYILKDLVNECIPLLSSARAQKKDKKDEAQDKGFKTGTIITINTNTKKYSGTIGGAGTTVINNETQFESSEEESSDSEEESD